MACVYLGKLSRISIDTFGVETGTQSMVSSCTMVSVKMQRKVSVGLLLQHFGYVHFTRCGLERNSCSLFSSAHGVFVPVSQMTLCTFVVLLLRAAAFEIEDEEDYLNAVSRCQERCWCILCPCCVRRRVGYADGTKDPVRQNSESFHSEKADI